MRFAVIGSAHGHINQFIKEMLAAGGEFAGVFNDGWDITGKIVEKYGVKLFDSIEEMFDQGIDIAGTSAVNNKKIDIIEQCAAKGVHIMADKPIAVNEAQYERLEKVVNNAGVQVGLMLTVRFMKEVWTLKKAIDNGKVGKLLSVEILSPHKLSANKRPGWHFEKEENGGIIIDLMIHSVDLFRWLTGGEITEYEGVVQKSILPEKKTFYDSSQFFVNSSNGVSGYFRVDWHMPESYRTWGDLRIFCTGTKDCIEARVVGDPLTGKPLFILFREECGIKGVDTHMPTVSVTRDFLNRIAGKEYVINHDDILKASRIVLDFDKKARVISAF